MAKSKRGRVPEGDRLFYSVILKDDIGSNVAVLALYPGPNTPVSECFFES